jgi:collagenase-like PrtC family protease
LKIITGISNSHSPEEIEAYSKAGVDEFFIGYIPKEWKDVYGFEISCNRREHSRYQYHKMSDLEDIVRYIHESKKKVFLTLNAHEYNYQQFSLVRKILKSIDHIPFDGYILSNFALMLELRNTGFSRPFNISIGAGNSTTQSLTFYQENVENINRFILPRKFTIKELEEIAMFSKQQSIKLEAFILGDPCHFSDEYCFTWHGAANESLCNSPMYRNKEINPLIFDENWKDLIENSPISKFFSDYSNVMTKINLRRMNSIKKYQSVSTGKDEISRLNIFSRISKCGLCAIQKFKEWEIEAVKLPLRGYSIETNLEVIKLVRKVIIEPKASPDFCKKLLNAPKFCSGENCYYNYPYSK